MWYAKIAKQLDALGPKGLEDLLRPLVDTLARTTKHPHAFLETLHMENVLNQGEMDAILAKRTEYDVNVAAYNKFIENGVGRLLVWALFMSHNHHVIIEIQKLLAHNQHMAKHRPRPPDVADPPVMVSPPSLIEPQFEQNNSDVMSASAATPLLPSNQISNPFNYVQNVPVFDESNNVDWPMAQIHHEPSPPVSSPIVEAGVNLLTSTEAEYELFQKLLLLEGVDVLMPDHNQNNIELSSHHSQNVQNQRPSVQDIDVPMMSSFPFTTDLFQQDPVSTNSTISFPTFDPHYPGLTGSERERASSLPSFLEQNYWHQ